MHDGARKSRSKAKPEDAGKGRGVSGSGNAVTIQTGVGALDGDISDSLHRQMEGRHVSAFNRIKCRTVLEGRESEPESEAKTGPAPIDTGGPCDQIKWGTSLPTEIRVSGRREPARPDAPDCPQISP